MQRRILLSFELLGLQRLQGLERGGRGPTTRARPETATTNAARLRLGLGLKLGCKLAGSLRGDADVLAMVVSRPDRTWN